MAVILEQIGAVLLRYTPYLLAGLVFGVMKGFINAVKKAGK